MREVEVDALDVGIALNNPGDGGAHAAPDIRHPLHTLESIILGQQELQQLFAVVRHRRLELQVVRRVAREILELLFAVMRNGKRDV